MFLSSVISLLYEKILVIGRSFGWQRHSFSITYIEEFDAFMENSSYKTVVG